jgi:ABC-type Zn uptake system ZnuABC Zn-binding protein ZnuA
MKPIFVFVSFLLTLLTLRPVEAAGIMVFASASNHSPEVKVVATTEDLAAIAKEVGGERVQVESLAKGVQDPHFLEAKPSLILKLSKADLFIQVGLDLEAGWVPSLLVGARNGKIQIGGPGFVDASRGITPLEVPTGPIDRSAGDIHLQGNPHYWLDPMNGKEIARNIGEGLKRIDPERAPFYDRNIADFSRRLDEAAARWEEKMKPFAGTKVITYHKSWPYFLKRFGLTATGYIEPKPSIPPSASHLNDLIELIQREQVKVILMEPYFSDQAPKFVAEKTGAKVVVLPPSVSVSTGIKDYFQLFDYLADTIAEALR